ncbi:Uncharacterised protein [Escherichia albertii]|nr:Uncharacterised protein [Escherichia coli]
MWENHLPLQLGFSLVAVPPYILQKCYQEYLMHQRAMFHLLHKYFLN